MPFDKMFPTCQAVQLVSVFALNVVLITSSQYPATFQKDIVMVSSKMQKNEMYKI